MRLRDAAALARLLVALRSIWNGFEKITPKMVTDSLKLLYTFFTGKVLPVLLIVCVYGCSKPIEPVRVDPNERSLIVPQQVLPEPTPPSKDTRPEQSLINLPPAYPPFVTLSVSRGGTTRDKVEGTLIGGGNIVTCNHLFTDSTRDLRVHFPNGTEVPAEIVRRDTDNDLALVFVKTVPLGTEQAKISDTRDFQTLQVRNSRKTVAGQFVKWQDPGKDDDRYYTAVFTGTTVSGDSGSGIYNQGGLYGVLWGCRDGQIRGTCGKGFRDFLYPPKRRLVVVSDPKICKPCRELLPVLARLRAAGYDVTEADPETYTPPVHRIPTLVIFEGDEIVSTSTGFQSYNALASQLDHS